MKQLIRPSLVLFLLFFSCRAFAQDPESIQLTGIVKHADGRLATTVWVILVDSSSRVSSSLTGDDGKFYFEYLRPGAYRLFVSRSRGTQNPLSRQALDLRDDQTLSLTVPN